MLLPSGNPIKCHEEVLSFRTMIPPNKRFDIFPPCLRDAQKVYMRSDFSYNNGKALVQQQYVKTGVFFFIKSCM